jgi:hypothetical protein
VTEVVQGFVGHASGERPVTDDGYHVAFAPVAREFATVIEGDGEAVGVRERRRRVARLNPVVRTLGATRVPREAPALSKTGEVSTSTGQQFVDVGLVAGVPEQDVLGGVEHSMKSKGQFDDAQV